MVWIFFLNIKNKNKSVRVIYFISSLNMKFEKSGRDTENDVGYSFRFAYIICMYIYLSA